MNEELERMIAYGEALIVEKERLAIENQTAAALAKKQEEERIQLAFWAGVQEILPASVVEAAMFNGLVSFDNDNARLRIVIDGCPVVIVFSHWKGEKVKLSSYTKPFKVAGISAGFPSIYEGEVYPGGCEYSFYWRANHDRAQEFDDLGMALAMARREAARFAEIVRQNEVQTEKLTKQLEAEAATKADASEPVYVSEDSQVPSQSGQILNMDELYLFIKGIVQETLEAQGQ